MTQIYLVRHGQAEAGWDQDINPPLSKLGQQQAQMAAKVLCESIANIKDFQCIASPIKRAHETAQYFANAAKKEIIIENRVAEIPSPMQDLQERMPWLMSVMKDEWPNLSPALNAWRNDCIAFICSLKQDSIIFSHYIAINVMIGHCQHNEQVISYHPDNCSIHHFENEPQLHIVSLGKQAETKIH